MSRKTGSPSTRTPKGWRQRTGIAVGCAAAGALICLSMPPWGFWPLAFLGLAALDRLLDGQKVTARLMRGWLVTGVWLLGSTFWMLDLSVIGYFAANITYSFFYGIACALTPGQRLRRLALPGWLVLVGYLRWRWPFGGVPLATLAQSQSDAPLGQVSRVLGPLLIVALAGVAGVAITALLRRAWFSALSGAAVIALGLLLSVAAPTGASAAQADEPPGTIRAALVQGGGPQRTRASSTDERAVFDRHLAATETITEPLDVIFWPENVVNVDGALDGSSELEELKEVAKLHRAWFFPGVVEDGAPREFLNFSVAISPDGDVVDRYDKVRLVPFGEYVPLRGFIERFAGDNLPYSEARAGTGEAVLNTDLGRFGIMISWEVFFEDRARDAVKAGGEVLFNPTNGSSYWLTIVQSQQVASSRLRAIESGRWVLQAAPTGFSAVVNPAGRVLARTDVSEQAVLFADVEPRSGMTWAARAGPLPMLALAAAAVCAPAFSAIRTRRLNK